MGLNNHIMGQLYGIDKGGRSGWQGIQTHSRAWGDGDVPVRIRSTALGTHPATMLHALWTVIEQRDVVTRGVGSVAGTG